MKTQYQTTLSPEVWNMTWDKVTKQTARNETTTSAFS